MPEAIALFRKLVNAVELGMPPPPEAGAWLVSAAQLYEARAQAGDPISLDRALGLGAPGRPNWVRAEAREHRNALLRDLRRRRFPHLGPNDAAREIAALVRAGAREIGDGLAAVLRVEGLPGLRQLANILKKP